MKYNFGIFGFSACSHVYLLNYRSELAQIWRQDTDTIYYHNHTPKNISTQVWSAIMGRNGGVVLGAYFQMVLRTDLAHFLYSRSSYNSSHTFCLDLIFVQPSPVLWYKVSPHKCQQKLGFSDVQKCFPPNTGVKVPNLDMSCSNDLTY